jgi:hypothetical protein
MEYHLTDAYNVEIQNLAKASQAYDRGLERFVGKFDSSVPMTATMAIGKGCQMGFLDRFDGVYVSTNTRSP